MRSGIVRWLSGLLASVLLVAAVSGLLVLFQPWLLPLRVLYILAVVPVAIVWGTGLATLTAVLSALAYDYLFIPPIHSFKIADARNDVALGVFLVTAVVVGGLAARLRRAAVESGRLSEQQAALRRVATLVARGAPPPEVFSAVARELAEEFGATITAVLRYEDDGTATIVGGWGEPGMQIPIGIRLKVAGQGVAVSVRQTGAAARTERFDGPRARSRAFSTKPESLQAPGAPSRSKAVCGVSRSPRRGRRRFPGRNRAPHRRFHRARRDRDRQRRNADPAHGIAGADRRYCR